MRILVITQVVDRDHPVLGFMEGWLSAFSSRFKSIVVICLQKGNATLPPNVRVHSLGKEGGASRAKYLRRFYAFLWRERNEYDAVFVHMNHVYVLLGWFLWRIGGKKIALWYNHTNGSVWVRVAMALSDVVFHTSPYAFTAGRGNSLRMPAGVDTRRFSPSEEAPRERSVLFLGRIAPLKDLETLLRAVLALHTAGRRCTLTVAGAALPRDREYEARMRVLASPLIASGAAHFIGPVRQEEAVSLYREHSVFVNLTPRGNYDKTVVEAAACGAIPIVSSPAFRDLLPEELFFEEKNPKSLAEALEQTLSLATIRRAALAKDLRARVIARHDLSRLADEIRRVFLSIIPQSYKPVAHPKQ